MPLSVKLTLFSFLAFATLTLALAISTPDGQLKDPKALISNANIALESTMLPLRYVTSDNATSRYIRPVINEVVEIVAELVTDLQMSSLSVCDCSGYDIIKLTAIMFKVFIIFEPLGITYRLCPNLGAHLGRLVAVLIEFLDVLLVLVGGTFGELAVLLIQNGCAGIMFELKLIGLLTALGLEGFGRLSNLFGLFVPLSWLLLRVMSICTR